MKGNGKHINCVHCMENMIGGSGGFFSSSSRKMTNRLIVHANFKFGKHDWWFCFFLKKKKLVIFLEYEKVEEENPTAVVYGYGENLRGVERTMIKKKKN